ncbi:diguanylate cyclase [Devosia sp. WQ 349]|uniref:GGDEF domain-containing protein n=1 Tax=Devosia sp. WQ 349K1 TaxID=2800329 RepID=UPI00190498BF|nr:diguanylate cyclase [Devosia sp. WQ 349K1]
MVRSWLSKFAAGDVEPQQRRASAPIVPADISDADRDPSLGTISFSTFTRVVEQEKSHPGGALLFIDLNAKSARMTPEIAELHDETLIWLAQAIVQCVRSDDLVSHVEGYKFAVLLRGAQQEIAASVAERILQSVDNTIFLTSDGIAPLGVDVGGIVFAESDRPADDLVRSASDNLDTARTTDRRICVV